MIVLNGSGSSLTAAARATLKIIAREPNTVGGFRLSLQKLRDTSKFLQYVAIAGHEPAAA